MAAKRDAAGQQDRRRADPATGGMNSAREPRSAELVPLLDPPLMGFATANYEDLRQQLAGLVHPGFLRDTPFDRLNELPRFLKGMRLRAERLRIALEHRNAIGEVSCVERVGLPARDGV